MYIMFPKIQSFMNNFMIQPVETVEARGTRGVGGISQNPFAGAVNGGMNALPQEGMQYLNNATSGSVYKNGMGHSNFGLMKPYLA